MTPNANASYGLKVAAIHTVTWCDHVVHSTETQHFHVCPKYKANHVGKVIAASWWPHFAQAIKAFRHSNSNTSNVDSTFSRWVQVQSNSHGSAPPTRRPTTPSVAREARRNVARLQQQLPPADRVADVPHKLHEIRFLGSRYIRGLSC